MTLKEINDFQNMFDKLVECANKNINLKTKDDYILMVYKLIELYFLSLDPYNNSHKLDSFVHITYDSENYGKKVYRLFCPKYNKKEFSIPNNISDIICPIVDFNNVINYYKNINKKNHIKNIELNIQSGINELLEQGLTIEEIEIKIKDMLYKEKNHQKLKK